MPQIFVSPGKYVQGAGVTGKIGHYVVSLGKKALILGGQRGIESVRQNVIQSLTEHHVSYHIETFQGESSDNEIKRMCDIGRDQAADVVIGIGGGTMTQAALAIARLCYDILMRDGYKAKIACGRRVVTEALDNIVEANTLLSGLGFESAGLAACHAVHNGLTVLEETHPYCHGEKVAFGTLTQLVLENRSIKEIEEVITFCRLVGLPTTLADIGLESASSERIRHAAEAACIEGETIYNMDMEITPDKVYAAMMAADALGHTHKHGEENAYLQSSAFIL